MTGRLNHARVAVTYPADSGDSQVIVKVNHERETILQISTSLRWRRLALTAAFLAAESLDTDSPALETS